MNSIFKLLPIALLSLAAAAPAALGDNDDDTTGIPCPGCQFINSPSPPNPPPGMNQCNTELKVTVFGLSGACEREHEEASCLPASNCWSLVVVDYKSDCMVLLHRYPGGSSDPDVSNAEDPSTGWRMIFSEFKSTVCGSPAETGYYTLQDVTGYKIHNSYKYYCASCED